MGIKQALRNFRSTSYIVKPLMACLRGARAIGMLKSERFYRHLPYLGLVTAVVPGGGTFRIIAHGNAIENGLYWDGVFAHEPESMRTWLVHARGARTVLDIGANSGVYALAACAVGAGAVHAFEPMPRVAKILLQNQLANDFGNLHVWQVAVGGEEGVATLYDPGGNAPTSASLSAEFAQAKFGDIPGSSVQVVTVDAFCALHGITQIDLIKLDVEGHEEHALRGMRASVMQFRPVILIEVLEEYEQRLRSVVSELFEGTYVWDVVREGNGGPDRNVLLRPVESHAGR